MWRRPLEWNLNGTTDPRDGSVDHLSLNSLKDRHGPIRAPKSLVDPEILAPLALRTPDRVKGVEQGTVCTIVGAELQCREQPGHHPSVIGTIRGAHRSMDAPALRGSQCPGFADQRLKGLLADDRKDDLAHHALRSTNSGLGYPEQDTGLAAHLTRLLDEFLDDPTFGFDGNAVRNLD